MKNSKTFIDMDKFAKSFNELVMCNEKPMKIKPRSKEPVHKWFAEYYANWHDDLSKNLLSLLNATFTGGRTIVGLNRDRMANIIVNDLNFKEKGKVIERSLTERQYTELLLYLEQAEGDLKFFEVLRRSEKGRKGSAMILKLIHPQLRSLMDITPEFEEKWLDESKDFKRKKLKAKAQPSGDSANAKSAEPDSSAKPNADKEVSAEEVNRASYIGFKELTQEEKASINGLAEKIPDHFMQSLYLSKSNLKNKWPKLFLEDAGSLSKLNEHEVVFCIKYLIGELCSPEEQEKVYGYCIKSYLKGLTKLEVQQ